MKHLANFIHYTIILTFPHSWRMELWRLQKKQSPQRAITCQCEWRPTSPTTLSKRSCCAISKVVWATFVCLYNACLSFSRSFGRLETISCRSLGWLSVVLLPCTHSLSYFLSVFCCCFSVPVCHLESLLLVCQLQTVVVVVTLKVCSVYYYQFLSRLCMLFFFSFFFSFFFPVGCSLGRLGD